MFARAELSISANFQIFHLIFELELFPRQYVARALVLNDLFLGKKAVAEQRHHHAEITAACGNGCNETPCDVAF